MRSGRVLLGNVTNTSTAPLFTYFSDDGNAVDVVNAAADVPVSASVRVTLSVSTTARNAPPLRFSATAALRNNR